MFCLSFISEEIIQRGVDLCYSQILAFVGYLFRQITALVETHNSAEVAFSVRSAVFLQSKFGAACGRCDRVRAHNSPSSYFVSERFHLRALILSEKLFGITSFNLDYMSENISKMLQEVGRYYYLLPSVTLRLWGAELSLGITERAGMQVDPAAFTPSI